MKRTDPHSAPLGHLSLRWQAVEISRIVSPAQAKLSEAHIERLRASFARLGGQLLLQPILLNGDLVVIDGAHRLEAAKRSGWRYIGAQICEGVAPEQWPLLVLESNRVRKEPSPLELEAVWREHYEPELRAQAKARQLAALRRYAFVSASSAAKNESVDQMKVRSSVTTPQHATVLGNPKNEHMGERPLTIARAAKLATGLSIETLNKVSRVRALAEDASLPVEAREHARRALEKLAHPGARVDTIYRQLRQDIEVSCRPQREVPQLGERAEQLLARNLEDVSLMAERLQGSLGVELGLAARNHESAREQLRAMRVALAHSLATVVAIECRLERAPVAALRRIGSEVSRVLSATSLQQLKRQS